MNYTQLKGRSSPALAAANKCDLPVVMLSNTIGYVTSPGFIDNQKHPKYCRGEFSLTIPESKAMLVNFIRYRFMSYDGCKTDYLLFSITPATPVKICKWKTNIQVYVLHNIFIIAYESANAKLSAFNITFAVLPKPQIPKRLPSSLFNCTVPHFHSFSPVFNCNRLKECEGGEDEQDCGHRKNDCGMENTVDSGTKCYVLVLNQNKLSWHDAHKNCTQRGHKLATVGNPEEFRRFKALVSPVANLRSYLLGAQLMERFQTVSTATLYRNIWQWVDGRMDFTVQVYEGSTKTGRCTVYDPWIARVYSVSCYKKDNTAFICEYDKRVEDFNDTTLAGVRDRVIIAPTHLLWKMLVVRCPHDHVTRDFLSCDFKADCGASYSVTLCNATGVTLPMFVCQRSRSAVHYTLVCDYMQHCSDNSDEDFCEYPDCPPYYFKCSNSQCIHTRQLCDGKIHCYDGSDETCYLQKYSIATISLPGTVYMDGKGNFRTERMNNNDKCPQTHFLCPRGFCLPIYLRCNGVDDCVGRQDEVGCDRYKCGGFYRCRGSKTCLHAKDVCDGIPQCPEQDDELLCDLACPHECRCQGQAFVCSPGFSASSYLTIRYLDASGSNTTLSDIHGNIYLIALRMSKCRIARLPVNMTFPNLLELDLSWNDLYHLHFRYFSSLGNLRVLVLAGNPLVQITNPEPSGSLRLMLEHIDLSYTSLAVFNGSQFSSCSSIKQLNFSRSQVKSIAEDGFRVMPQLEILDLRGCRLQNYPNNLLRNLTNLKVVHSENYKLCCEDLLPVSFDLKKCHAKQDLLASCEDLLKSNSNQVFLWIFVSLALVGNVFSVGARLYLQRKGGAPSSFNVFVTNLSISDLFMGVYLSIIGTADLVYRGRYLWHDDEWKNSAACNMAGFLCLLSSETSAFIICLITLDRFLVLRFPFSRLHFGPRSALAACGVVWAVGISLATIPLLPVVSHWEFYSQTGICIPLPITSNDIFRGYDYSFSVSILLNLVLFLLIAVGQAVIYWAVRSNSMPSSTNAQARDAAIARRLITVVLSDFLCWFPIGMLGLLAYTGTPIPGYLNVVMAVFVLPVNSALNPFLYTFNLLMEKRKKAQNEQLLKRLELDRCFRADGVKEKTRKTAECDDRNAVILQIKKWIREQLITSEDLLSC